MSYTVKMTQTLRKGGAVYAGPDSIVRPNLTADMLAVLVKAGDGLLTAWAAAASKGGAIDAELTREVTSSDGSPVPAGASGTMSFGALTDDSLGKVQRAQHKAGGDLMDATEKHHKAHGHK